MTSPSFITVSLAAIPPGQPLDFALYRKQSDGQLVAFKSAGSSLTDEERAACLANPAAPAAGAAQAAHQAAPGRPAEPVYVASAEYDRYHCQAEAGLAALLADESGSPAGSVRFDLAYQLAVQLVQELLDRPDARLLNRVLALVGTLVADVQKSPDHLAALLDQRSWVHETPCHMVNVALLAMTMAGPMKIPPAEWPTLVAAGMLHDIGKIGLPENLVRKEGRLTQGEWVLYREHCWRGGQWLTQFAATDPLLAELALSHHETLDGRGFPRGLSGSKIHPRARLLTVLDTYDLLVTARPFRDGVTPQDAQAILRVGRDKQFDPDVIDLLSKLITEDRLPRPTRQTTSPSFGRANPVGQPLPLESYMPLPPTANQADGPVRRSTRQSYNRRNYPRHLFKISCRVRYLRPGAAPESHVGFWVHAVNISRGGIQFIHIAPVRLHEVVSIFLPDGQLGRHVNAMIVRCNRGPHNTFTIAARFDYE